MAANKNERNEIFVQNNLLSSGAILSNDPVVLSCGGIYIPQSDRGKKKAPEFHIINVLNEKEPTKVVSGTVPRNILKEILAKECMN